MAERAYFANRILVGPLMRRLLLAEAKRVLADINELRPAV